MADVVSFAEEICWNGEDFRVKRKQVGFRLYSIGRHLGDEKIDAEFMADYGLWWDQEDEILMHHLESACDTVRWRELVYHKKLDHSGIDIFHPDSDMLVARIEVRAYEGRRLEAVDEDLGDNVLCFATAGAEVRRKRELSTGKDPSGETTDVQRDPGDEDG